MNNLNKIYFSYLEISFNEPLKIERKGRCAFIKKRIIDRILNIMRIFPLKKVILIKDGSKIEVVYECNGEAWRLNEIPMKEIDSIPDEISQNLGYIFLDRLLLRLRDKSSLNLLTLKWIEERIKEVFKYGRI